MGKFVTMFSDHSSRKILANIVKKPEEKKFQKLKVHKIVFEPVIVGTLYFSR